MRNLKRIIVLPIMILFSSHLFAQQHHTFGTMKSVAQSMFINPAFVPKYRLTIAVPGASIATSLKTGFTYNQAVTVEGEKEIINLDKLVSKLADKNMVGNQLRADGIFVSFQAGPDWHFHLFSSVRTDVRFFYPKNLIEFAANGNASTTSLQISPELAVNSWVETGFGASYKLDDKWTFGLRLKFNRGFLGAETKKAIFNVNTVEGESITVQGDIEVVASNIEPFREDGSDRDTFDFGDIDPDKIVGNLGPISPAIDIGATFNLNDKWTFGLSLIDIGTITYKNTTTFTLDPAVATYSYTGIPINDLVEAEDLFEGEEEELSEKFEVVEKDDPSGKLKVALPAKVYLNADYKLSESVTAGAVIFAERYKDIFNGSFGLSISKEFGHLISGSLSFNRMHGGWNNMGAGVSFNFTPFQLYFAGDNLLSAGLSSMANEWSPAKFTYNIEHINLRFGMNFIFGVKKKQSKLTVQTLK